MTQVNLLEMLARAQAYRSEANFITPWSTQATSFSDLFRRAGCYAALLQRMNTKRVAGVLTPSPEMVALFIGVIRAGADFVSLPLPGRGLPPETYEAQLKLALDVTESAFLALDAAYAQRLSAMLPGLRDRVRAVQTLAATDGRECGTPAPGQLIQFSSGTTGVPKAVTLSMDNIGSCVAASIDALELDDHDNSCEWVPLSHDMGLIGGLLTAWARPRSLAGPAGRYTCMAPELFVARPLSWLEACAAQGATATAAPTFAYQLLARQLERAPQLDLSKLRICMVGAEPIPSQTLQTFAAAAQRHGFSERAFCPGYGLAEATLSVSIVRPRESWSTVRLSVDGESRDYVSCGRPVRWMEVSAPFEGQPGPILVRGPSVCAPAEADALATRPGWLDTKDLGVLSGGELVVTGRSDDLMCFAGRNIFAWEIEQEAARVGAIPAGHCLAAPDGQGRYAVLLEVGELPEADLRRMAIAVQRRLAGYVGVGPSLVGCLPGKMLPKTPSGKLRRAEVGKQLPAFVERCLVSAQF